MIGFAPLQNLLTTTTGSIALQSLVSGITAGTSSVRTLLTTGQLPAPTPLPLPTNLPLSQLPIGQLPISQLPVSPVPTVHSPINTIQF
jgi:hypothetical protein